MKDINTYINEKLVINKDSINTPIKDKKADDPTTWDIGDILVVSSGYNMILVDFYQIIRKTNKSFVVKELKKKIVSGDGWQGECVPLQNEFYRNDELSIRINKYNRVKIDGHYASLWNGKPAFFDHMD